ncbi:DUF4179 domain-containing protein [Cohnella sp. GCM10020058]|uniref:DUF4179 domain-containing protein n=1 Tax=Cohnella sp. GCM10020058 TaxID=3317330 RepID=UPI003629F796
MEKWEQQLSKQVNVALPEHVDRRIQLTLDQLKRTRKRSSKLRYGITAIAASLLLTVGLSSLSPSFAAAMKSLPLIGSVFELVGDVGVKRGSQLHLTANVGQQVRIGDQLVTFTESLYDGSNINLGLLVTDNNADLWAFSHDMTYAVDGEALEYGVDFNLEKLGDGTYAGTLSITPDAQLPDSFVLGILSLDRTKTIAEIPVERKGGSLASYAISQTRKWNNIEVNYEAVTSFPTATELTFQLRNTDAVFWAFQVYDEQNRVLEPLNSHGQGVGKEKEYKFYFEPLGSVPQQLTIKPYLSSADSTTKWLDAWNGTPVTLSQGKAGALTILDEKRGNDQITLTYEVSGARIFDQVHHIWLEDGKGNRYDKENGTIRREDGNRYQVTFSNISDVDALYVCTYQLNVHYLKELEVTVDLTK